MEQENKRRHVPVSLVVFLGMLAAIAPLSTDMYLPTLPEMMGNFNVSSSMVQLTLTFSMAGMAAGQLFAGPVSDEKGRRMPLLTAMVVFAVSTLGCFFSNTVYVFLLCRLIQGLSGGAGIVIARAVVRDVASGPALMRLFSMLMLVNGLAPVLGPVIGGQILRFFSWRGVFGFLFLIALCLTAGAAVFRETLKEKKKVTGGIAESIKNYRPLFKDSYFMGHCLMQCFSFAAFFGYISGSSFVFQNVYHVSAQTYSYIFGVNGIGLLLTGALTGRLAGHIAEWKLLRVALTAAFSGSLVLLAGFIMHAPLFVIAVTIFITVSTLSAMGSASFSLAMQKQGKSAGGAAALIGFFSLISGAVMAPVVGIGGSDTALPMGIIIVVGEAGALLMFYKFIYIHHKDEHKDEA